MPLASGDAPSKGQDGPASPTGAAATDGTAAPKLDRITYAEIMSCLIKTGLLQRVIQLPNAIDINNPDEEGIIRLCMKLLISIIFKGQQKQQFRFSSSTQPEKYQSVFAQTGITDQGQM